ncbi:transcriptional activator ligand binding domain protein [Kribbella flavida DSM 17836]|uniref:Transcriptional activator ligand binding domain protein n=1 Tax=Kribbella flavida (strain DSM 17836 / JCM 10339 / NBRC 14399) TaxID=479435 RepID=D2PPV4_KRIFD|nr:GyrI-like domain-containing protein [Kribbella flavida]ADB32878.1 transcriptional activator ligand binding domain protein [Kribbella flavida DSM 17836]
MHTDRPETRTLTTQPTAVRRALLHSDELSSWLPRAFGDVAVFLYRQGIAPKGYPFARYHPHSDGRVHVEAGFPVADPITGDSTVVPSSLPGGHVVAAWHNGPADQLRHAYHAITTWLTDQDATPTGDAWEIYHDLPAHNPHHHRTEVVQPITLTAARV